MFEFPHLAAQYRHVLFGGHFATQRGYVLLGGHFATQHGHVLLGGQILTDAFGKGGHQDAGLLLVEACFILQPCSRFEGIKRHSHDAILACQCVIGKLVG